MYYVPPYLVATLIMGSLFDNNFGDVSAVVDWLSVAALTGSVFVVSRTLGALKASEAARSALRDEREAAVQAKERVMEDVVALKAKLAALEARPDLSKVERLLEELVRGQQRLEQQMLSSGPGSVQP